MNGPTATGALGQLATAIRSEKVHFVLVNIGINLILLARSFATMKLLDHRGLGMVTVLQSLILLLGTLQIGFINGGFRLICSADRERARRINNLVFTFFAVLSAVSLAICGIILLAGWGGEQSHLAPLGVVGGVLTLVRAWLMNRMISEELYNTLNRINFCSAFVSLAVLALAPWYPEGVCLAALVIQPGLFVLLAFWARPALLPDALDADRLLGGEILQAGFVVFLTGIFLQVGAQAERWYVTSKLGLEALGHLYLAFLFLTVFQLVPTSLDQVFLPSLVRAHERGDGAGVSATVRRYFLIAAAYCALTAAAVAVVGPPAIDLLLPGYLGDLRFVDILLPGLIVFTLSSPFALIFNVLVEYRYYFLAYGSGMLLTLGTFVCYGLARWQLGLDGVTLLKSLAYGLTGAIVLFGYTALSRQFPDFRFGLVPARGRSA